MKHPIKTIIKQSFSHGCSIVFPYKSPLNHNVPTVFPFSYGFNMFQLEIPIFPAPPNTPPHAFFRAGADQWLLQLPWRHVPRARCGRYPLVICYIAMENDHRNSEFSHYKLWLSTVMWLFTRCYLLMNETCFTIEKRWFHGIFHRKMVVSWDFMGFTLW